MLDHTALWRFTVKNAFTAIAMAGILVLGAGAATAETVWKWTGKDGKPVYGKQPPAGVKAEQVDIRETNVGNLGPARQPGGTAAGSNTAGGTASAAPTSAPAAAKAALEPVVIGGKLVESGSVRLKARAEGRDLNPARATCPPEVPTCRKKGDAAPSGSPRQPMPIRGPVPAPVPPAGQR